MQYGHVKQEVEIVIDESVSRDTLLLSKTVIAKVTIPTCISFQTKWDGRTLSIGPVIAFFTVGTVNALTANLERFLPYFSIYPHFRGLVYICACDGVDRNTKTIHGYYYDYHDQNNPWKEGTFPYPNTIYRKTGFSRALYNEFVSELGDNIFNTYFFNKWELWEWLAQSTKCSQFLPFTEKLMNNATQLEQLLETFDEVYLKQVDGHKAKGIIKVFKDELGTHFKYRLKGERVLQTKEEIEAFLNDINVRKNYLVQQSIPIKRFEARNFDFRVIMQRNRTGKWICTANIARFGKKDSIATNFFTSGLRIARSRSNKESI
ncbi:MAG: YheC/YheD family protein [Bacillaceae bacterium]|nr:YheC/YheD family protein [Bacillaceae bacterium]